MSMKLLARVKRVANFNVKIWVKPVGLGMRLANIKMAMSPFSEVAIKEAALESTRRNSSKPGSVRFLFDENYPRTA